MELKGKHIGLVITRSFCTFTEIEQEIPKPEETEAILRPIISENIQTADSRFGDADEFVNWITYITGNDPILCIEDAEPISPKAYLDILFTASCTGNTLAKLANGITDTPMPMAAKVHLRNAKPLVISVSTNDALGINLKNIGRLFNSKNICFAPLGQDDLVKKPSSIIACTGPIENILKETLEDRQIQPAIQD